MHNSNSRGTGLPISSDLAALLERVAGYDPEATPEERAERAKAVSKPVSLIRTEAPFHVGSGRNDLDWK